MLRLAVIVVMICLWLLPAAQEVAKGPLALKVTSKQLPVANATVELLRGNDSLLIKAQITDAEGMARFQAEAGSYLVRVSRVGFVPYISSPFSFSGRTPLQLPDVVLQNVETLIEGVTVTAYRPIIELQPHKTIVNVDAAVTNSGATMLEALEKMPGVTIDRDGNISLQGKSGVLVLIDGKPTYLNGGELSSLLSSMSAAQVSQVELLNQPPARYDAAGNAGVINIKTKKNDQRGINGSLSTAAGQGFYHKNNNSLQLNYRSDQLNVFLNYSLNWNGNMTRVHALRSYFKEDGTTVTALLEQPSFLKHMSVGHNLRAGLDYFLSTRTTLGVSFTGLLVDRASEGNNKALWKNPSGVLDSIIHTHNSNPYTFKNGGTHLSFRHQFSPSREFSADVDGLCYRRLNEQFVVNSRQYPTAYSEGRRAFIPSDIQILSAKADYTQQVNTVKLGGGWKSAYINTDNPTTYQYRDGNTWRKDEGRSNHFLYEETIHAVYATAETSTEKWSVQGGLRYEHTNYDAHQISRKDSSFSRTYSSLFPTGLVSFTADSANTFTLSAGRRIDRPAFQKLNPFQFIINKYTYQQGNPFYRPQFTWNVELGHLYKGALTTAISYNTTRDYFSQIFTTDSNGTVTYTEGNLKRRHIISFSLGVQLAPVPWWSVSAQAVYNYKKLEGTIVRTYRASIHQGNINISNQFRFTKGWSGELSGFYNTRSQEDVQEILDPSGQLSLGVSKSLLKNKATLKLSLRDVFYTNWLQGLSFFLQSQEQFKMNRDTRVATLAFTWRFGKPLKSFRRSEGAAGDEMQRVGAGN